MKNLLLLMLIFVSISAYSKDSIPDFYDEIKYEKNAYFSNMSDLGKLVIYPDIALRKGIEGTVNVKVYITEKGKPTRVGIVSSDHVILNEAAMNAIKNYKDFIPAIKDGKPAGMWLQIPIKFILWGVLKIAL